MLSISGTNDTDDSCGDPTLTNEVGALLKKFSQLNMDEKMTLKYKVCELSFPNITSMCTPPNKVITKGALKFVKSTKHVPLMWE